MSDISPSTASRPRVVFDADRIARRVTALAREIEAAFTAEACPHTDQPLLLVGLMKGSFIFLADLVRSLNLPVQVDFMGASSYGDGVTSSGSVRVEFDPRIPVEGRRLLLIEDIVDSGTTLASLVPMLQDRGALRVEVCTLLHKRLRPLPVEPRFVGFDAPNLFLVGYGMDYAEDFRHLPYIASL